MTKVYCKDCKWLGTLYGISSYGYVPDRQICTHPDYITHTDTPLKQTTEYGDYYTINKNNNCPSFEEKKVPKNAFQRICEDIRSM